jgi:hypothetical protein
MAGHQRAHLHSGRGCRFLRSLSGHVVARLASPQRLSAPLGLVRAGLFFNAARQIMPRRLQIPFYKRAGFLGICAHVCGSFVKRR